MPDDFARTQAQIAATCTLPAATVRAAAAVAEVRGASHLAETLHAAADRACPGPRCGHDHPSLGRDVPAPSLDNLANLED